MDSNRKTAIIVGVLILIAYGVLASSVIESRIIVMLFEAISGIAVIGIAILMFPIFRPFGKKLTLSYLSLKSIEGVLMIIAGILYLSLNTSLLMARDWIYVGHAYIFIISAFLFYYLLYESKIIPRFISIWGVISLVFLLTVNLLQITGYDSEMMTVFYLPIVSNEVFLALWLMIKGFDQSAIDSRYKEIK